MLMIVRATCQQTLSVLADAEIDTALADDLHRVIEGTDTELAGLQQKLGGDHGSSR
jgi:hypothetical protein